MNSLKGKKSFYLTSLVGCAFFAGILFIKILKHLETASLTEIAVAFVLAICSMICTFQYADVNDALKKTVKSNLAEK